jgi:nicotinate-nucleotide--dimethylbenzimidazole phosphoribosyltransferase
MTQYGERARARQNTLLKPPGSLGKLEELAVRLCTLQQTETPRSRGAACVLFAADHPVTKHGVSPYPSAVTATMVRMFLEGRAASTVMAKHLGTSLAVVDVGVQTEYDARAKNEGTTLVRCTDPQLKEAGDLRIGEAMSEACLNAALAVGRQTVRTLPSETSVLLLGEMGIGNTTPAAAIYGALLGLSAETATGRGTGADDAMLRTKIAVVRDAIASVGSGASAMRILQCVGGREIAALVGAMQEAYERRIAVVVDGFIASAAATVVMKLETRAEESGLFFSHLSKEQGHVHAMNAIGVAPYLNLEMRLGEATGALSLLPMLDLACALHNGMGTFQDAGL